jgi:hypothetical protein
MQDEPRKMEADSRQKLVALADAVQMELLLFPTLEVPEDERRSLQELRLPALASEPWSAFHRCSAAWVAPNRSSVLEVLAGEADSFRTLARRSERSAVRAVVAEQMASVRNHSRKSEAEPEGRGPVGPEGWVLLGQEPVQGHSRKRSNSPFPSAALAPEEPVWTLRER